MSGPAGHSVEVTKVGLVADRSLVRFVFTSLSGSNRTTLARFPSS